MPAVDELMTLVYCSDGKYEKDGSCTYRSVFAPSINSTYFPNTSVYEYWSSSPNASGSSYAWVVFFNFGYSVSNVKNVNGFCSVGALATVFFPFVFYKTKSSTDKLSTPVNRMENSGLLSAFVLA